MTSSQGPVRAAVQRGDLGWLAAHLAEQDCPPAVLKLLVRHDDPRLRHLGLDLLGARIARPWADESGADESEADESELAELAGLLPRTLDGPPETALLLARLHQRLWRHVPLQGRPRWRAADLPVRVRIAWLRAEILHRPATLRHEPAAELLCQAVEGIAAADPDQLEEFLRELTTSGDHVLHGAALRLAREGLHGALLAPARAREHLGRLLDTPSTDVAVGALRELAEPWAALAPFPRERLRPFLGARSPAVIDAAIAAATRHGHGDLLREAIADEAMPPRSRQQALQALGELARREDIRDVTAIAAADPLLFGGPAVACLRALHRRGLFPAGDDAAAVVDLALADHTVAAAEVAAILFTCRHEAFRALVVEDADDATWPRRLALLVGLARQGSGDLPAGDAIAGVLPATSRPEPFLSAIRALRHTPAEAAVIAVLPRAPGAALDALEAIGGSQTVAALEEGLGLTPPGVIAPHLRPVRHQALELLWHLTDDPGRRRTILDRLHPRDVPRRIAADLGAADQRELALLGANFDPDRPAEALLALARNGDAAVLPGIADLLLRIVADLTASEQPDSEPAVPDEVVAAISAYGRRLHDRGKLRPFCLREAADADEAGRALVATIALDLLDRPGLSGAEQAILLALLRRIPYADTPARVHRLLRHRDRHVRKHVIALLAADALSASLIALTAARDGQTVRQALLALGGIRAHWAAPAIAAGLDHPTMNIKKTAAAVLVHAGTPAVVPKLLFWLGHHDNPGLRATLTEALRAILGNAYAATVLAAAEQAGDDRTRGLLLDGLDGVLSARAVQALAQQGSPAAPILLARLSASTGRAPATGGGPDQDVDTLLLDGWHTETARRILGRQPEHPAADQLARLRPMLADWLHLADAEPATRPAALRLTVRLCPAPWTADEIKTFARAAHTLIAGLAGAAGDDRDDLLALLEAVAPTLHAAQALDLAAHLRALAPTGAGHRSPLTLLRRCGAVLTRADVERTLASARLGPDPWLAETAILRDAFAVSATPTPVGSRDRLNALVVAFPSADREARGEMLDWMEALQPIDAPPWTLAENADRPTAAPRTPHDGDLDQPRSAAQRDRLLALLDAPAAKQRNAAAAALRDWPEPETRRAVLHAFLRGRVDVAPTAEPAPHTVDAEHVPERVADVAYQLAPSDLHRLHPLLLEWWEHGEPGTRAAAERALRRDADALAESLRGRLDAGSWGFLDLIAGRPLLRTPALTETCRRLRAEGRDDLADKLTLVDGPLRQPDAAGTEAAALAALRERPQATAGPSRDELLNLVRTGHTAQIRRALTLLDEDHEHDPELESLIAELLHHPEPRIRLHAHRTGRKLLDRPTYLRHTAILLDDPEPDVIRSAITTLSHAAYEPAIPALVGLLAHPHTAVRTTAANGLVRIGPSATPALRHAAGRARPDKRHHYTTVLNQLTEPEPR